MAAAASRMMAAMTGVLAVITSALGWLGYRSLEPPILAVGSAAVVGALVLVVALLAWNLGRNWAHAATAAESGRFNRVAAQLRDKTAALIDESNKRQNIESELERYAQRERMFAAAVESAGYPIITMALDGIITAWNPAAERIFGHASAEAIGRNIGIIVPPDRREEHAAIVKQALAGEPVENFETMRIAKGGRQIHVAVSLHPVKSSTGEIVGLANIARDLTAGKLADEKFRLVVESCPSGIIMIDPTGKVVMINAESERLFGYRRDELIGQPVDILVPMRLRGQHARHRTGFTQNPETRRMGAGRDLFGQRKDGTEFPVEVGLNPIQTSEGLLILSVIVDISERKRLERLKDEFVSTVSHELRTPLTSISGSLGLLVGGATGKLPDSAARLLAIAQANSQRLVRLVNDILDIEKLESNRIVFNLKRLEARTVAEQAIEGNRGFADGYGVRIRLDEASAAGMVHADPDRLAQVITNLLSNAIKFSPSRGEVTVAIQERDQLVRISVRDHGPGVPAEFRPHVFEKFAQADAGHARQKGGTGLGLSIVKQIVTRLGGTVDFEDAAGGGTEFHVELPAWDQAAKEKAQPGEMSVPTRILLCADDAQTTRELRDGLRELGFATDLAHTAADAEARTAATPYAAIVVDLDRPDGESIGLVRNLRSRASHGRKPIVGMSTDASREYDGPALSKPDYRVDKPVDVDVLAQTLDQVVFRDALVSPQVLHIDDDPDVRNMVAHALCTVANVMSVGSIAAARQALESCHFDLAVLDVELGPASGLELLPHLRNGADDAIPVIVFSAHCENQAKDPQIKASLSKSPAALDSLVTAVHDRLKARPVRAAGGCL
jgi:PAS domain S-box-containing protein